MEVQIIQICKKKFLVFFFFSIIISSQLICREVNPSFSKIKQNEIVKLDSFSGNYLSWLHAQRFGDLENSSIFISKLRDKTLDIKLMNQMLLASLLSNKWDNSVNLSKKILKLDHKHFFSNIILSTDSFIKNDFNLSKKYLDSITHNQIDSKFIESINYWILFSEGKNNELNKIFTTEEDCSPIHCLHHGIISRLLGNKKEAKKNFDWLLDKSYKSYRVMEILLPFYIDIESNDSVNTIIKELQKDNYKINKSLKVNSENFRFQINNNKEGLAEVFFNISGWFYEQKLYMFSAYFGNIGLHLSPDFNALKMLLADVYQKLNIDDKALYLISSIDKDTIYYTKTLNSKLKILSDTGDKLKVIEILEEITKKPSALRIHKILLADSLRSEGLYKKSLIYYNQVIEAIKNLDEKDWQVFYSRGITNERLKNWGDAEKDFLKALQLNPNEPYVLNYIAYSWLERNIKLDEALEFLLIAVEKEPNDAYIIDSLGWAYFLLGNYEKSIDVLEYAVTLSPNDSTLNDHLGDAYWKVGRYGEAVSQWKRVLLFEPEFKDKKKVKNKIIYGI